MATFFKCSKCETLFESDFYPQTNPNDNDSYLCSNCDKSLLVPLEGKKMRTIHKFVMEQFAHQYNFQMPFHSHILCVGQQENKVCMWALVDPSNAMEIRRFILHGTGHPVRERERYIGTAHITNNLDGFVARNVVAHVFENTEDWEVNPIIVVPLQRSKSCE